MKRLSLILSLVALAGTANATNYYVSATGNDANNGTSTATPWKTLSKVSAFTFAANDSILLKRGDVFFGAITVNRNNLNFSAYGAGARPLITGFVSVSSWTLVSSGIYKAAVNAKANLNMVSLNGRPQQIGRYPNATDAGGGFLNFEAATATSITDNEMTAAVNWTGAELIIRKNGWKLDRCIITSQAGGTFNYRTGTKANGGGAGASAAAKLGFGYFIQDDIRTLDQMGEWFFDSTAKMLNMYFGSNAPAGYTVKVSTIDTLLNINNRSYVSVSEIDFEGAGMSGVYSYFGGYITVKNCDFTNIGSRAIHASGTNDLLVDGVRVFNCLSNSIQAICNSTTNVTVRNCLVRNNGQIAGMGSFYDDSDYKGIYVGVTSNCTIQNNVVDSAGAAGIQFNGSAVLVEKNYVNYFCNITHDNGGIYTYAAGTDALPGATYTNRIVRNNIIGNGVGAPNGTNSPSPFVAGIYLDGRSMNVLVSGNTVFNSTKNGIHCNNPASVTIRDNTFFNNIQDISFTRWAWGSISNLNIKKNISFPYNESQRNIYYTNGGLNSPSTTTIQDNVRSLGSIDSNYYNTFTDGGIQFEMYDTDGGPLLQTSPYSLDGWRSLSTFDARSKRPAQKIQPYTIVNTIGTNAFTNSQFTSNVTGLTLFGASTTVSFDNTSKITGAGSLRMDFAAPLANRYSLIHSPVGGVSSAKRYMLRFKTLGTTPNGIVRAYIRKTATPFNNLVPTQMKSFGTSKATQEFLFDAPITDAGASLVIEIEQNSGTTYIDDVEFYEVNATINTIASQVRFEYNATGSAKTVTLDAKYIGVDSTVYNGTITLPAFTSQVLVKAGPIDSLPLANAGADKVVYLPSDSVVLTGTGTGSVITTYTWAKIAGPASFTIANTSAASTKVTGLILGVYKFELRVTDNKGHSSKDTITVTVSSVLPVRLVRFAAAKNNNRVDVNWTTSSEISSQEYIVERKINGKEFESIGRVASGNDANRENNYRLTDNNPAAGINYYRLKMVDRDGSFSYSNIVSVQFQPSNQSFTTGDISLSSGLIKLTVSSSKQQLLNIVAVDAAGRVVFKKQVHVNPGTNTVMNSIAAVNKGVYYIKMFTEEDEATRTVLSE